MQVYTLFSIDMLDPPSAPPAPSERIDVVVPIVHRGDSIIRPDRPARGPVVEATCLLPISLEYLRSLKLDLYFNKQSDCFCMKCRPDRRQKTYERGGYPYTVPYGWVQFHIKTERVHIQDKKIFQRWATSYYGTWEKKLEQILRNRFIPFPGDALLDRTTFSDHSRDGQHCFTSPSINYTGNWQRSPANPFTLSNGNDYNVQMILRCKQKPGTFIIQEGATGLCDIISHKVIEWKSKQRATIIPIGLMIKIKMVKT
jgi:hypothetical protein